MTFDEYERVTLLLSELKDNITRGLNSININATVVDICHFRNQTKSHIYLCLMEGLNTPLIIKIIKQSHASSSVEKQAKLECDALMQLYNLNSGGNHRLCPEVYPIMTDMGAVLMEYVRGPTLTKFIPNM